MRLALPTESCSMSDHEALLDEIDRLQADLLAEQEASQWVMQKRDNAWDEIERLRAEGGKPRAKDPE